MSALWYGLTALKFSFTWVRHKGLKMARNAIESEFRSSKMADQSEIIINAIESDF